ncbi:hypothetical protein K439DRAFT_1638060 [Ramaria rubella]|nr:hypothetical protein K439DRAFT_1638060 [Ramaria rubella]
MSWIGGDFDVQVQNVSQLSLPVLRELCTRLSVTKRRLKATRRELAVLIVEHFLERSHTLHKD